MGDDLKPVRYRNAVRRYRRATQQWHFYRRGGWSLAVLSGVSFEWLAWAFAALVLVLALSQRSIVFAVVAGAIVAVLSAGTHGRGSMLRAGTMGFAVTLLVGEVLGWVAWPLRLVVLPAALATLACHSSPDGRPAHRLLAGWVTARLREGSPRYEQPSASDGTVWAPQVWVAPDEGSPVLHYGRVQGPARLVFARPVVVVAGRGRLIVRPAHGHQLRAGEHVAEVIERDAGQVAEIRT
jgi:type III secretory pathway component EscS